MHATSESRLLVPIAMGYRLSGLLAMILCLSGLAQVDAICGGPNSMVPDMSFDLIRGRKEGTSVQCTQLDIFVASSLCGLHQRQGWCFGNFSL